MSFESVVSMEKKPDRKKTQNLGELDTACGRESVKIPETTEYWNPNYRTTLAAIFGKGEIGTTFVLARSTLI